MTTITGQAHRACHHGGDPRSCGRRKRQGRSANDLPSCSAHARRLAPPGGDPRIGSSVLRLSGRQKRRGPPTRRAVRLPEPTVPQPPSPQRVARALSSLNLSTRPCPWGVYPNRTVERLGHAVGRTPGPDRSKPRRRPRAPPHAVPEQPPRTADVALFVASTSGRIGSYRAVNDPRAGGEPDRPRARTPRGGPVWCVYLG